MRLTLHLSVALSLGLSACAGEPSTRAANPHSHCAAQGMSQGTDDFDKCVNTYVADLCTGRGHELGTTEFGKCASDLQQGAFLRQQLEMRGY